MKQSSIGDTLSSCAIQNGYINIARIISQGHGLKGTTAITLWSECQTTVRDSDVKLYSHIINAQGMHVAIIV